MDLENVMGEIVTVIAVTVLKKRLERALHVWFVSHSIYPLN
jgi:hypothetical protein